MSGNAQKELISLLTSIKDTKKMGLFLSDILSHSEFKDVVSRWQIVKMLNQGMSQREIAKKLGISIAKVTRGSRVLKYGKGGFAPFLKRKKK